MISEEEINLWLRANRLVVMQVDDYTEYRDKNIEIAKELEATKRHLSKLSSGSQNRERELKKKHGRLRRRLEKLKTDYIRQCLCSLASVKNRNRNTQLQTL